MKTNKTYNDALGWARRLYKDFLEIKRKTNAFVELDGLLERLEEGFPELKESEDEWIRKHIIEILNRLAPCHWDGNEKARCIAYLDKQKEQKSLSTEETELNSIAFLAQMGYTCIPPGKEQKPAEKQDYHGLSELERAIHRGFLCAGVENVPVEIIKGTAQECRLVQMKSTEWSEEDEKMLNNTLDSLKRYQLSMPNFQVELQMRWLKSLRPQPHWKPSEEQMQALKHFIRSWGESGTMSSQNTILCAAKSLYNDLKKL